MDRVGHHFRRYRRPELVGKITRAGFSVRFVRYFNTLLLPPIAAVRLVARLLPEREPSPGARVRTDFDLVSRGPLNAVLTRVLAAEAALLDWRLPFGVSLVCVAERPAVSPASAAAT